jgi:hypothetical protein
MPRVEPAAAHASGRAHSCARAFVKLDHAARYGQQQGERMIGYRAMVGALGRRDQHAVVGRRRHVNGLEADAPASDMLERVGALEHPPGVALGGGGEHCVVALYELDHPVLRRSTTWPAVGTDRPPRLAQGVQSDVVGSAHTWRGHQCGRHCCLRYCRAWG